MSLLKELVNTITESTVQRDNINELISTMKKKISKMPGRANENAIKIADFNRAANAWEGASEEKKSSKIAAVKAAVAKLSESDDFQFGGGTMDASSPSGPDMGDIATHTDDSQMSADNDDEDQMGDRNPEDAVSMDVPLLIRIMEFAKEDAKTDMDLHKVVENLVAMSEDGRTLSMDDYDAAIEGVGDMGDDESDEDSGYGDQGTDPTADADTPPATGQGDNGFM